MIRVSVQLNLGAEIAKPKKGQSDEDGRAGRANESQVSRASWESGDASRISDSLVADAGLPGWPRVPQSAVSDQQSRRFSEAIMLEPPVKGAPAQA